MVAFAIFMFGAGVMALIWLVVELAADRIKEARQDSVSFPIEQMESITEQAMRSMLWEALQAKATLLEMRGS